MQFFTANGIPLVGGKLYTYVSGTTTPLATYVDQLGSASNPNPVIMDSRGEAGVWLASSQLYTMVLKDSLDNLIWTSDGVGSSGATPLASTFKVQNFSGDGTTVAFVLTYEPPNENNTQIYINGAYQQKNTYSLAASTITFSSAPPLGTDNIEVMTIATLSFGYIDSSLVNYIPAGVGAIPTDVQTKLYEQTSVFDFGATGNGTTDDTAAIQAAVTAVCLHHNPAVYASGTPALGPVELFFPVGVYKITSAIVATRSISIRGEGHSEFSTGARVIQYTAATDHFRIEPIAQGSSVSFTNMTMIANGGGGTGGSCINITKATGACASIRVIGNTFGTPQTFAIKIQTADDVMIHDNLFDVSATTCIGLGTAAATDIVSNCAIRGNTAYSIASSFILAYNVYDLIVASNRIYPSAGNMGMFLDGYNSLPYQLKNIVVQGNTLKGINCLMKLTSVIGLVVNGNTGVGLGAGTGATLSCIELTGTCSQVAVTGNDFSGTFDTKNFYNDTGATVTAANISGNIFNNTGGTGQAVFCAATSGTIAKNACVGFVTQSVSEHFYTSGSAISPGVIAAGGSFTFNKTVAGARQGDNIQLSATGLVWPFSTVGIVCWPYVSAAGTVSIRYDNVTAGPIGVPAHDFGFEITR